MGMSVQFIRTPAGETMVVLSMAEYNALKKAAGIDHTDESPLHSSQQHLPDAWMMRIHAGEHPIRVWRDYRGLTLDMLSEKTNVTVDSLRQIEKRQWRPSRRTLRLLAQVLQVPSEETLNPPDKTPDTSST
jgi:ribosome-binding protein aMBF1 (putative translation factor)